MFQHVRLLQSFSKTEITYLDYRKTEPVIAHAKQFNTNCHYVRLTPCSVVLIESLGAQCVSQCEDHSPSSFTASSTTFKFTKFFIIIVQSSLNCVRDPTFRNCNQLKHLNNKLSKSFYFLTKTFKCDTS